MRIIIKSRPRGSKRIYYNDGRFLSKRTIQTSQNIKCLEGHYRIGSIVARKYSVISSGLSFISRDIHQLTTSTKGLNF